MNKKLYNYANPFDVIEKNKNIQKELDNSVLSHINLFFKQESNDINLYYELSLLLNFDDKNIIVS